MGGQASGSCARAAEGVPVVVQFNVHMYNVYVPSCPQGLFFRPQGLKT